MTYTKMQWFRSFPNGEKNNVTIKAETYEKAKQRFNKLMPKKYRI